MTIAVTARTAEPSACGAGRSLAIELLSQFDRTEPDAVILFASAMYDHQELLNAFIEVLRPAALVGCSTAAEFVTGYSGSGSACAIGIRSSEMSFKAAIGHGVRENEQSAARELAAGLDGLNDFQYPFRSALVLADALAGHNAMLVKHLDSATGGMYKFFGGAASDAVAFENTPVFHNGTVYDNAVVALEILSNKPVGVGVAHGWSPRGEKARVTEASGKRLISISAAPAVETYEEHAVAIGQEFNRDDPLPFFLHNVIGIEEHGKYRLRVPLSVNEDGSVNCATEVPEGSIVNIMGASGESTLAATREAVQSAKEQLDGNTPCLALFFDCIATRVRLGKDDAGNQLIAITEELGSVQYGGFNSYGQIARADGQHDGFHNCTALVCLLPS